MTTVLSITNIGGAQYSIVFSSTVTRTTIDPIEASMLLYSPSSNEWVACQILGPLTPSATVVVSEVNGDDDCTFFAMLQQPDTLNATPPFQLATPIYTV